MSDHDAGRGDAKGDETVQDLEPKLIDEADASQVVGGTTSAMISSAPSLGATPVIKWDLKANKQA